MMTENGLSKQQTIERAPLLEYSATTSDVILVSEDSLEPTYAKPDKTAEELREQQTSSLFEEISAAIPNLAVEASYAGYMSSNDTDKELVANSYVQTVDFISGGLGGERKELITAQALAELKKLPESEALERAAKDNRILNQLLAQKSRALTEANDEIADIQADLIDRRLILIQTLRDLDKFSPEYAKTKDELAFLAKIIGRSILKKSRANLDHVQTPSAETLEENIKHIQPTEHSPAEGMPAVRRSIGRLAVKVWGKIKDKTLLNNADIDRPSTIAQTEVLVASQYNK